MAVNKSSRPRPNMTFLSFSSHTLHLIFTKPPSSDKKIRAGRKPSSVSLIAQGGDHLSGPSIARRHKRPTRKSRTGRPYSLAGDASLCGLAPGGVFQAFPVAREPGGLLPHRFTLALCGAVCFSVALSMGSPPVSFRDRLALWSSDFPPPVSGEQSPHPL